jgi:hypothetical protein
MSFVTAVPETRQSVPSMASAGHVLATPRLLRKFWCALGATTDSAGVQDGLIRDVTNCRTGISREQNMR